ncbi:MAG: U32 family peptidase [Oscillospiraceae bacterium]
MREKHEVLAPCGSMESLAAALNTGADAVYVGLKEFSARKNAENFSVDELREACRECHRRGVRVYVTVNTLVYDDELALLAECIKSAAECGADGLIIQDFAAAELAKAICPEMERHASTQMTLNSVQGVLAAERAGFSRVVLGRELSLEQIRHIAEQTSAELEVFVHGALCVSISGQCYMSSVFGGRSGNRGLCAQPCRLDFSCGERHSVISLKDSSVIEHLCELAEVGVTSFKIEGRMKRPEYVAAACDSCVKALHGEEYDAERLVGIFSRGGLTDGYFTGDMSNMQGTRGKEDVEASAKAMNGIKALYKDEYKRFSADISAVVRAGEPITAKAAACGVTVSASAEIPQAAVNSPTGADEVISRLSKLGGTQFFAGSVTANTEEGLRVSAAALNGLRRELCEKLDSEVLKYNTPDYTVNTADAAAIVRSLPAYAPKGFALRAEVYTAQQLKQAIELPFERIYAPIRLLDENTPEKDRIIVLPPLFLADCEDEVTARLARLKKLGFTRGAAHTLGHAGMLLESGYEVSGTYRLNVLNSLSAAHYERMGLSDLTLSFEGTVQKLSEIRGNIPHGILAYGRIPLMAMRRCPVCDGAPCGKFPEGCGKSVKDRRGNDMPVLCGGNYVELLNPDLLIMSDRQDALKRFDFALLKFTDESELSPVVEMYLNNGKPKGGLTRGLYYRGAE